MFDSIIIRPNSSRSHALDCGQMIENLFFYKKTIVHIGRHEIKSLFNLAETDVLEQLLKLPSISIYFNNSHAAICRNDNIRSVDSVGLAELDIEKELYQESLSESNDEYKSRKFAKKISRLIKTYELPKGLNGAMTDQLKDKGFMRKVLVETIKEYYPNLKYDADDLRYDLEFLDEMNFKVHTNIIFNETSPDDVDSPLLAIINTCADLQVMSENLSDISLPEFNSKMIRLKMNSLLQQSSKSSKEIEIFSHFVFDEARALREAINTKKVFLRTLLQPLQKAEKFKEWLNELPNDSNLMYEYLEKIEERSILEKLPFKAIRFYLVNSLGEILSQIDPSISVPLIITLNAFDTFLLSNFSKKWKPNQFIENDLRPLVKPKR